MHHFDYHRPHTLPEAFALKAATADARYVAGGTDLLVRIKNRLERPTALISLRRIAELAGIEHGAGGTRIGAATLIADIAEHPDLSAHYPVLVEAAARLGSSQIRNRATIGGNLCNASPCADTATPLLVLEAQLEIAGAAGVRQLPISDWFTAPGQVRLGADEVLTAIRLAPQPAGARGTFRKKGRVRMDLALVNVAVQLTLGGSPRRCERARIAAGAVAPVPLRLGRAEQALEGQRLTVELAELAGRLAAEDVSPISDVRASAEYRRRLVEVYVRRAVRALAEQGAP